MLLINLSHAVYSLSGYVLLGIHYTVRLLIRYIYIIRRLIRYMLYKIIMYLKRYTLYAGADLGGSSSCSRRLSRFGSLIKVPMTS